MVDQTGYFELMDWLENEKSVQPDAFFKRMQSAFGIANLLYIDAAVTPSGLRLHRLHHTFGPAVERSFQMLGAPVLSRVVRTALRSVKPLDLSVLLQGDPLGETLGARARQLGLPLDGVSYPLISQGGRSALLAINVELAAREWPQYRRIYDRDIHALAAQFHAAMLEGTHGPQSRIVLRAPLTPRERETLAWTAAGKSYWEIAVILGISERTVRFFMTNARRKLNAVSNTQAVAEAVWHGLISHP